MVLNNTILIINNPIVIPQVRTYTRYGTGSVVMFDCAESPFSTQMRFRINELTSTVPCAVRSILRNDIKKRVINNLI